MLEVLLATVNATCCMPISALANVVARIPKKSGSPYKRLQEFGELEILAHFDIIHPVQAAFGPSMSSLQLVPFSSWEASGVRHRIEVRVDTFRFRYFARSRTERDRDPGSIRLSPPILRTCP